jgi:uncharacterized protein (TIGR03437 family)
MLTRPWSTFAVPGSALFFEGDLPRDAQARFEAGGVAFPLLAAPRPGLVALQMPWEFPREPSVGDNFPPPQPMIVSRAGSPFERQLSLSRGREIEPQMYTETRDGQPLLQALTQDFSRFISDDRPARPGETVHFYMTGLGPLDRPVATGEPGPANPAAKPLTPFACAIVGPEGIPAARGAVLPFVAYAPGLVGVYQIDLTIPEDWPAGLSRIDCYTNDRNRASSFLPVGTLP